MPTYGRTFTLESSNLTDIGAPAAKGGLPGQFTRESGFLSFYEVTITINSNSLTSFLFTILFYFSKKVCDLLKSGITLVWDNEQMVPYAYKDDQWVGFDDPRSFKVKVFTFNFV